jgi:DNA-binding NarL/FixJ family response regulator
MSAGSLNGSRKLTVATESSQVQSRRAVVYDPHPLTLEAIASVLAKTGVDVLVKATSPVQAVTACAEEQPELFVTSNEGPDGSANGYGWLREAHEAVPDLRSIVFSRHDDITHIEAAFEAGAGAYVVRTAEPEDLAAAVRQAFVHSLYLPHARNKAREAWPSEPLDDSPGLTRREIEILTLVSEGHSNGELARMLWVTEQTVKFHLSNVYRKLGVANRTEASRWAQLHGLLPPGAPPANVSS